MPSEDIEMRKLIALETIAENTTIIRRILEDNTDKFGSLYIKTFGP